MPDKADAQILQVLRRQAWQDPLVDRIVAECSLVLFKAEAPQPTSEVHDRARTPLLSRAPLSKGPPGQGDKTADYDAREIMSVIV